MDGLISDYQDQIFTLTLARTDCHNAFDDRLLQQISEAFEQVNPRSDIRCVMIQAEGKHFCAGADLNWMRRMAQFSEAENFNDSMTLAKAMQSIYRCPVPTICLVQGAAMGGGAGLVAACDMAIAADNAFFSFSEAKLGLIPAVISPYVVEAIGIRATRQLFCTAEKFDALTAKNLGLLKDIVPLDQLISSGKKLAREIISNAPEAVRDCKKLIDTIKDKPIDPSLLEKTASLIAAKRVSKEGQSGLKAFLHKTPFPWSES